MSQMQTRNADSPDAPVPDIDVRIVRGDGPSDAAVFNYQTDKGGNQTWPVPEWTGTRYTLYANQPLVQGEPNDQYNPAWSTPEPVVSEIRSDGTFGDAQIFLSRQLLKASEHGPLHVHGRDFMTEDNQYWQFRGYTVHYLPNAAAGGYPCAPIKDILAQAADYGYNTIVSVGMHASPWKYANGWAFNPLTHPNYFPILGEMFDAAEDAKMRVAHGVLADMQHLPRHFDKQWFWRESCAVMRGRPLVFPRKGNEDLSNGWHPSEYHFPDMPGQLLSQGSRGEKINPYFPYLHWAEFEVIRKAPKMFIDFPLRQMMDGDFAGPATNRPTVNIEPMYFADTNPDHVGDERSTDVRVAREMGMMMLACSGGAFGCSLGLEGKILPHNSISDQCARAFIDALRSGFKRPLAALDFQGDH